MINNKKPLVIIAGPTAIGKTEISIELAKAINGEIISADSMQVYKGMNIGTAKITSEEMQGVKHYLIDILDPKEDFNVVAFKELALSAMNNIWEKGKIPIIVGGTGFYIQSVLYDIDFNEEHVDSVYRHELENIAVTKGNDFLHNMLRTIDPKSAQIIHANNVKRVIRALEFYKETGSPISEHNEEQKSRISPYNYCYIVLNDDRDIIYSRIDRRVDMMIEAGLVDEVKELVEQGLTLNNISMLGLGYKEIFDYLNNEYSLDEAIRLIKRDTRHFAKKQLTWFKREKDIIYVQKASKDSMLKEILDLLKDKDII